VCLGPHPRMNRRSNVGIHYHSDSTDGTARCGAWTRCRGVFVYSCACACACTASRRRRAPRRRVQLQPTRRVASLRLASPRLASPRLASPHRIRLHRVRTIVTMLHTLSRFSREMRKSKGYMPEKWNLPVSRFIEIHYRCHGNSFTWKSKRFYEKIAML